MSDWRLLLAILIVGAIFVGAGLLMWGGIVGYISFVFGCLLIIGDFYAILK
jgi:hypothetical protein